MPMSAFTRWLKQPWYLAQLLTSAKSFADNPILGSRRLNERGLHMRRVQLAHAACDRRRRRLASRVSSADRTAFDRDGYLVRGDFLPPEEFAALVAQLRAYRTDGWEIAQGNTLNRKIAVDSACLRCAPALHRLLASPAWRNLLAYVGGCRAPPLVFLQTLHRQGREGPIDPQTVLHADTFHPTVKAWLFLTDVAQGAGPFTYVPGSHRLTPARLRWEQRVSVAASASVNRETREGSFRIDVADLPTLGLPPPIELAVPANTLVVADTFGFHARGPSAQPSHRVELFALGSRHPFFCWGSLWSTRSRGNLTHWGWRLRSKQDPRAMASVGRRRFDVSAFDRDG
jgi:hypothetical protein